MSPLRRYATQCLRAAGGAILILATARCGAGNKSVDATGSSVLRLGVSLGTLASANVQTGLRQIAQNLTTEALVNFDQSGRPVAWLAQGWTLAPDGLSLQVQLRPNAKFHDGTPVTADAVVKVLETTLPRTMGIAYEDVDRVTASGGTVIDIRFKRPSSFLIESLDAQIREPGKSTGGTSPFELISESPLELSANKDYYRGSPRIGRVVFNNYPSVRSAWADLLRDKIDMLYDAPVDALDSLEKGSNVAVFSYVRHYQYAVVFNPQAPHLRSPELRRALNAAINREALVKDALNGHGIVSNGPISPRHWVFRSDMATFKYDPQLAQRLIKSTSQNQPVSFTCLVAPDYSRVALVVKRQLQEIGVDMVVKEMPPDQLMQQIAKHDYDAFLVDPISGPGLMRPYGWWHSKGAMNPGGLGTPASDEAWDRVRHAVGDDNYRAAVASLMQFIVNDPPGIFLAWGERARAISKRFEVPTPSDRDVLSTIYLWRPAGSGRSASSN